MRSIFLCMFLSFLFATRHIDSIEQANRFGKCQKGLGGCGWFVPPMISSLEPISVEPQEDKAIVTVYFNDHPVSIEAMRSEDRFSLARKYCEQNNVHSAHCAPSIGQRIGDALFCQDNRQKYQKKTFRFLRTPEMSYSIEFDLIRDILVDAGMIECTEAEAPPLGMSEARLWVFDVGIQLSSLSPFASTNLLDRLTSALPSHSIGNKVALRRRLKEVHGEHFLPRGWAITDLILWNTSTLQHLLYSKQRWVLKDPNIEGGAGVRILDDREKLFSLIHNAREYDPERCKQEERWARTARFAEQGGTKNDGIHTAFELQEYVDPPMLLDNRRFSIGIYVLVTSIDPLIVWIHEADCLVLLAIDEYKVDSTTSNVSYAMHMTNGAILRNHPKYSPDKNKWNRSRWKEHVGNRVDTLVFRKIRKITSYVFASFLKTFREGRAQEYSQQSFGGPWRLDFLVDKSLRVYLLEVETMPSTVDSAVPIESNFKRRLFEDIFRIVGWTGLREDLGYKDFHARYSTFLLHYNDHKNANSTYLEENIDMVHDFDRKLRMKGGFTPLLLQQIEEEHLWSQFRVWGRGGFTEGGDPAGFHSSRSHMDEIVWMWCKLFYPSPAHYRDGFNQGLKRDISWPNGLPVGVA